MVENLTAEAFKKFGEYVQRPVAESSDGGAFHEYWHELHAEYFGDEALTTGCLSIIAYDRKESVIERHLSCAEIFVTVKGQGVIAVADPSELERAANSKDAFHYFRLKEGDAVLLKQGVWHMLPVPDGGCVDFLMIVPKRILSDIDKKTL